jgi:hypothetical protein
MKKEPSNKLTVFCVLPVMVAEQSKARTVFALSDAVFVSSNPTSA